VLGGVYRLRLVRRLRIWIFAFFSQQFGKFRSSISAGLSGSPVPIKTCAGVHWWVDIMIFIGREARPEQGFCSYLSSLRKTWYSSRQFRAVSGAHMRRIFTSIILLVLTILLANCGTTEQASTLTKNEFEVEIDKSELAVSQNTTFFKELSIKRVDGYTGVIEVNSIGANPGPVCNPFVFGENITKLSVKCTVTGSVLGKSQITLELKSKNQTTQTVFNVNISAQKSGFSISTDSAITVEHAKKSAFRVNINRFGDNQKDIVISAPNLPSGVVISPARISKLSTSVLISIKASETSWVGSTEISLEASSIEASVNISPKPITSGTDVAYAKTTLNVTFDQFNVNGALASERCPTRDFNIDFLVGEFNYKHELAGWLRVNQVQSLKSRETFHSMSGIVHEAALASNDFPTVHNSHDFTFQIEPDKGQDSLISTVNYPNSESGPLPGIQKGTRLEVEWESGILPSEKKSQDANPATEKPFPKWAWPSDGDRVWVDGSWIFDCGHARKNQDSWQYPTEIHPPRAIAVMKSINSIYSPIVDTTLYISGQGGYVIDILNCGYNISKSGNPDSCPIKHSPINTNFEFDIPAPPRPSAGATLQASVFDVGDVKNAVNVSPILDFRPLANPPSVHVTVPLAGSGIQPSQQYAKKIQVSWDLRNRKQIQRYMKVTLESIKVVDDKSGFKNDCECAFFFMNNNRVPGWTRLSDYLNGNMGDLDTETYTFNNYFDLFIVPDGEKFNLKVTGFQQDCIEDYFGNHDNRDLHLASVLSCVIGFFHDGTNEVFGTFEEEFEVGNYTRSIPNNSQKPEYYLQVKVEVLLEFTYE
jgi:hypothetical protein